MLLLSNFSLCGVLHALIWSTDRHLIIVTIQRQRKKKDKRLKDPTSQTHRLIAILCLKILLYCEKQDWLCIAASEEGGSQAVLPVMFGIHSEELMIYKCQIKFSALFILNREMIKVAIQYAFWDQKYIDCKLIIKCNKCLLICTIFFNCCMNFFCLSMWEGVEPVIKIIRMGYLRDR